MKSNRRFLGLSLVLTLGGSSVAAAPAAVQSWRHDPVWDDGKAEFCAYDVEWPRYGTLFKGRGLLILVKEAWAPELDVKADTPRADGFEVLKLNHVRDVPTGIYTYHQMASVHLRRDSGALRKLATTSSEACGVTTAVMREGRLRTYSYFDGQGDREVGFPEGALPEDGLPALLRDFVGGEAPTTVRVFPSLLAGLLPELKAADARLVRRAGVELSLPVGNFRAVELRLEMPAGWSRYLFDPQPPHRLLQLERSDGTRYRLAKCERIAYWQMNRVGGGAWYPPELRQGVDY